MLSLFAFLLVALLGGGTLITPDLPSEYLEKKYANGASKFADIDGLRVHYRDDGQVDNDKVLVLVHGSNASLHTWEGWVRELSANFRIITMDLPGHGLTGPDVKGRYDWISMANMLDALVQKIGVERFAIAGNSMGGAVAWNYALMHPEKIEKLILIDSRGYPSEEPMPPIFKAYATPGLGQMMTVVTPRFAVEGSIRDLYGDSSKITDDLVTLYHDMTLRTGNREATRQRLSAPSNDHQLKNIGDIKVPTLVMWGKSDRWILPKYAQRFIADIEGARLKLYDDLGHLPMEEAPKRTAQDAQNFLLDIEVSEK